MALSELSNVRGRRYHFDEYMEIIKSVNLSTIKSESIYVTNDKTTAEIWESIKVN